MLMHIVVPAVFQREGRGFCCRHRLHCATDLECDDFFLKLGSCIELSNSLSQFSKRLSCLTNLSAGVNLPAGLCIVKVRLQLWIKT